jgi:hypothetical protein
MMSLPRSLPGCKEATAHQEKRQGQIEAESDFLGVDHIDVGMAPGHRQEGNSATVGRPLRSTNDSAPERGESKCAIRRKGWPAVESGRSDEPGRQMLLPRRRCCIHPPDVRIVTPSLVDEPLPVV